MPFRLDHIAVPVRDMAASVAFYTRVLGLAEVENPMGKGPIRWFALTTGVNLHLVPGNTAPLPMSEIGRHIALATPDFDAMVARLEATKVEFGEMPGRPGRVTKRPDGVRQCFVRDPDNVWIEINDAPPRA